MQTAKTALYHKVAPHAPSESLSPGLILLHGRGANEDDLLGLVPYFPPQFFVVAARAPFPFASGGATWYDTLAVGSPRPEQFAESYERLVEFVREIKDKYPVDPRRLFLLGFSMGAVMSFAFALTHPDEVKGIVAHSGYIPEETSLTFQWTNLKGKSFLVAHGTEDPVIGIESGRRAKELLEKTDADLTYREYPISHTMSEESVSDVSSWLSGKIRGER